MLFPLLFSRYSFLSAHSVTHVVHLRVANITLRYPLLFKYSKLRKTEEKAIRVINDFVDDVIRKRRQELIESASKENNNENGTTAVADDDMGIHRKKRALLDILLQSSIDGKPLSDGDIREEVDVFMFGVRHIFLSNFECIS